MGIGKTKQGKVKRFRQQPKKKEEDKCNDCKCEDDKDEEISSCGGTIENGVKNLNLAQEASDLF